MHEKVLPKHSLEWLKAMETARALGLSDWILAGGTGLALQLGHRKSEDMDFFRTDDMDVRGMHAVLRETGPYETLQEADHTLTVIARKTKVSFFRVGDPFLFKAVRFRGFRVADIRDIALMKLTAISDRGARREFVDLYTILRGDVTLKECLDLLPRKYGKSRINVYHILKSLVCFQDAEQEPMPVMLEPFDWKQCKAFFVRETHRLVMR